MTITPIQKRLIKGAGAALASAGALALLLFIAIQLPPVQRGILGAAANGSLASTEFEARVEGTGGLWPWRIRAARVQLADAEGVFLELNDLDVRLQPFALLGGSVVVDQFDIGGGIYTRQPLPRERAGDPFRLPTIPSTFEVQRRVAVGAFTLGPFSIATTDDPVFVQGTGELRLDRDGLNAAMTLDAGNAGHATLTAQLDARAHEISLDADVSDLNGRWLTPFTSLPPGTPIVATMGATGPQDNIALTSNAQWGTAQFQMDGTADWRDSLAVSLNGALRNALTGNARNLVGGDQTFEMAFELMGEGSLRIETLRATSQMFQGTLSGHLADEVNLQGEVMARDPAALASAFGLETLGDASLTMAMTGPRNAPDVQFDAELASVGTSGLTARDIQLGLQAALSRDGFLAEGTLNAAAASLNGEGLPPTLAGQTATLMADFRADFAREDIAIQTMNGAWGPIALIAEGDITATGPMRFEGTIGANDLTQLDDRLNGAGHLVVAARRARRGGALNISVTGQTEGFSATGELAQWIGASPYLAIEASVTGETVQLATAEAALAAGHLNLAGEIDRLADTIALHGSFASAELSLFAEDIDGTAEGDIVATGLLSAPALSVTARSPALRVRSLEFRDVNAHFEDGAEAGRLTLRADGNAGELLAELPYTRQNQNVSGDLSFRGAGLEITGPVSIQNGVPQGALRASADDVAELVALLRAFGGTDDALRAHGALDGDLAFEGAQGTVSLAIANAAIEGVDTPALANSINLSATLDVSAGPQIDGRLVAEGVRFGPSQFSVIDAKAQGPLAELSASLSLRGPSNDPFHLDVEAVRREAGAGSEIALMSAEGRSLDFEVELAGGGTLIVGPQGVELLPTLFAVRNLATEREGHLGAEARLWAGAPFAQITADDVPAGSLAVFGLPVDWTGILNGVVTLDARGEAAPLRVALTANELTNDPDLAPLDARLTIDASGEELEAQLSLTDVASGTPLLVAQSTMPLIWQSGRFTPAIDWDAPLDGFVRANAPLERLWPFVPVDSLAIGGGVDADVALAGTLGSPQAHGEAHVTQGTLEHFQTGFILRDAQGTLSFDQAGDLNADIRATDGNGGWTQLNATAHLPRAEAWMVDGTLRLNELTVARRDELHAQASGDLHLSGTLAEAHLDGTVTMDRIDAHIPNQLPPSVVDLPVVYVDGDGTIASSGSESGATQRLNAPIYLDVTVNIPRRAFVRGRGLDSEWGGSLALGGTMSKPRIDGTLSVVRGTFDLSRSRFTLTEGEIEFLGGDRIDPQVRIEGQAPGPEFTSIIRARGPARRPTITITSDPVMPQETVMSQILFGKRPEELSAFELVQIGEATASLSGTGGFDILGTARRAAGLDVLSIGARETDTGEQGVDVTVGRYVAPNVFVGARRGFEPGSGAVTVEMEVTPQVTLDAEVRQDSEGSVGVDWRRDY